MGAADRRVPGERQLARRAEDAQAVGRYLAGQEERGLGEVGPARDVLHLGRVQPFAIEHHRDRIAAEWALGERVDLLELPHYFKIRSRL